MHQKIISLLLIFFILFSNIHITFADEIIPDIKITLQNPSYLLDKELELEEYFCDKSKDECKVNFDLTSTFGASVTSAFACENNFSFITGEENKCNPSTIIFPNGGRYEIKFKVFEIANPSNFKEKTIFINNEITTVEVPDVNIEVQSGLDFVDGIYKCSNQNDCKINLNLESIFTGSFDIVNYSCIWDFSGGVFETIDTDKKCNPGYVNYGTGNFTINAKVYQKDKIDNFKVGMLSFENLDIINSNTGIIDNETISGGQQSSNSGDIEIPNVIIEIQSGLEHINGNNICKDNDCKVNLNLEKLFTGNYDISNYECSWNFGSGLYETIGTDQKCNPGYVNYGTGEHLIEAIIYEKGNNQNFKTGSLSFSNNINLEESIIDSKTSSGWQNITNTGGLLPTIKLSFQNPSYLLDKNIELDEYNCDTKESECKINFDLTNSFSGFTLSHYACNIILPFESPEKEKCNPNTITFPTGETEVGFKIYEKNKIENFSEKTILIKNNGNTSSNGISGGGSNHIEYVKEIILQSGASKDNSGKYICNEEICKINVKYENNYNDICLWDFSGGNFKDKYLNTCNPGIIYYPSGEYKINLKIFKNGNFSYFDERNLTIKNNFIDIGKEQNLAPIAKIKLQGTVGKNKEQIGNKLICKNTTNCSVNFDGSESSDANRENLSFYWDFGNLEYAESSNPKSINYKPGKYKISLKVVDKYGLTSEDYFYVEVYEKEVISEKINENIEKYIHIVEALPNPLGKEEGEWIKIKNNSINFINIKGLIIDDKIGSGSKPYIIKNDLFLFPYQEKKIYKSETSINLNNSFDEVNLIYNDKIIDNLTWEYIVPEGFIIKKNTSREKVKVERVIDGDTIEILFQDGTKEKLRLIGVDTPETKHPKKAVEIFGKEASEFTKNSLLGNEVELELDIDNYRDKYGRLLGFIWIDNISFNKMLIEKGYARAYLRFPFKYSIEFENAEKEAKKEKLGIWGIEELKEEIKLLEKLEKEGIFENEKMENNFGYKNIISKVTNLFDIGNFGELIFSNEGFIGIWQSKKVDEQEIVKEFDNLLKETLTLKNNEKTKTDNKKIITYKTSKLKSGIKITGNTYPDSEIVLIIDDFEYKTKSDKIGNYELLLTDNLKVGEYILNFLVANGKESYTYTPSRSMELSKDYIYSVQDYKVKQANKKIVVKKSNKKKKILAKTENTKKLKYEIENTKKEISKNETSIDKTILIFLMTLLLGIFGVIFISKFD